MSSILILFQGITESGLNIEGGLVGTVWFKLPACYHQNLGIFGEVWLFQNFCCPKNIPYPSQITFWQYNGKSIFWLFKIWTATLQKKIRIEIGTFSFQICFRNQFLTSQSQKCTYFYSNFVIKEFRSIFQKVKNWIFHCIFKKCFLLSVTRLLRNME